MTDNNKLTVRKIAAIAVTVLFFAFQMYIALVKQFTPMLQGPLHLVFALTLVYIYYPADFNYRKKLRKAAEAEGKEADLVLLNKRAWMNWLDIPCFA